MRKELQVTARFRRLVGVGTLCAALAAAGCGDDDDDASTERAKDDKTPTGKPITIGLTWLESGPQVQPEILEGTEATVRHINEDLGGIDGRPISLELCGLDGSPEGAARCANELLEKKPLAVVNGADSGSNASLPIYERADVAVVSYSARSDQANVNPAAVTLGGGFPLVMGAWAKFVVEELGAKKIGFLYPELVPAEFIEMFFVGPAQKLGASTKLVGYAPDAPDLTGPVTAVTADDPDVLATVFEGVDRCVQGLRTLKQVNVTAKITQLHCNEEHVLEEVAAEAEGQYFIALNLIGSGVKDNPDMREYFAFMEKHAPDADPYGESSLAAMQMMTLYSVIEELGADTTPAAVLKRFKTKPGHVFLGDTFECNALKPFPSLCVNKFRFSQYKDGKRIPASGWLDGLDLLAR